MQDSSPSQAPRKCRWITFLSGLARAGASARVSRLGCERARAVAGKRADNQTTVVQILYVLVPSTKQYVLACTRPVPAQPGWLIRARLAISLNQSRPILPRSPPRLCDSHRRRYFFRSHSAGDASPPFARSPPLALLFSSTRVRRRLPDWPPGSIFPLRPRSWRSGLEWQPPQRRLVPPPSSSLSLSPSGGLNPRLLCDVGGGSAPPRLHCTGP
jgi:hypothetical protein